MPSSILCLGAQLRFVPSFQSHVGRLAGEAQGSLWREGV